MEELKILTEGLKFTNKEINAVKRNSRNIMVAFEYEFTPDFDKMTKIKEGKPLKPNEEESHPPRDEITLDDVYEYDEYMAARDELEQEAMIDAMRDKADEVKSEAEEEFESNHGEVRDKISDLLIASKVLDGDAFFGLVDMNIFKYELIYNMLLDGDSISDNELRDFLYYVNVIRKFILMLDKGMSDALAEIYYADAESFGDEILPYTNRYSDTGRLLNYFIDSESFSTVQEHLDMVAIIELPDFSDFDADTQQAILFDNYIDEARVIAKELDKVDLNRDGIQSIVEFLTVLKDNKDTFHDVITDSIEKYTREKWDDNLDDYRDEVWERVVEYGALDVDLDSVISDIQDNNWVVVMDDYNDQPYVEPSDGFSGSYSGNGFTNNTQKAKEFMIDYGSKWGLNFSRDFEEKVDQEKNGMVEFKSNPVPLNDAIDLMVKMFKYINDVGDVSHGFAGLHTNMSLKNKIFGKDTFNKSKLMLLVDDELLHEFFPVREYIAKTVRQMGTDDVFDIALNHVKHNEDAFSGGIGLDYALAFEDYYSSTTKLQGINFIKMREVDISKRRMEFRAIGGKDYSERERTITWWVYRFAYIMQAAFDKDFLQKEYLKELIDILDKPVKRGKRELGAETFAELVVKIRRSGTKNKREYNKYIYETD